MAKVNGIRERTWFRLEFDTAGKMVLARKCEFRYRADESKHETIDFQVNGGLWRPRDTFAQIMTSSHVEIVTKRYGQRECCGVDEITLPGGWVEGVYVRDLC